MFQIPWSTVALFFIENIWYRKLLEEVPIWKWFAANIYTGHISTECIGWCRMDAQKEAITNKNFIKCFKMCFIFEAVWGVGCKKIHTHGIVKMTKPKEISCWENVNNLATTPTKRLYCCQLFSFYTNMNKTRSQ